MPSTEEDLRTAFKAFDKDRSGNISKQELKAMLKNLPHPPTDQDVEAMVQAADTDGDGEVRPALCPIPASSQPPPPTHTHQNALCFLVQINYEELVRAMKS